MRNIRLAFRTLAKTPFVTAVAVLSLALGIGANAAIYSLFDQVLLNPLPVPNPNELVYLRMPGPIQGSDSCGAEGCDNTIFSYPMFRDMEREQTVLAGIAGHRLMGASLTVNDAPLTGRAGYVTGGYFSTLGVRPALGRMIGMADNEPGQDNMVAVVAHSLWIDHLGGRPDVLGTTLQLNNRSYTIIGVAQREFEGTTFGVQPLVYVPMQSRTWTGDYNGLENRKDYWVYVLGRLKQGSSRAEAKAGLEAVVRPILTNVEAPLQDMSEQTLARFKAKEIVVEPGRRGQSSVHGEAQTPLMILSAITAMVLLIACANIANLLLARGAGRATEMSVRLALGSSRGRLVAQLLTESVVLAMIGGVVSLVVASWTLSAIAGFLPQENAGSFVFSVQPSVILFSGALAVVTGLIFGMYPALHSTRSDLITSIRGGTGQIAGSGGRAAARFRAGLVTAQIAVSTALLISAGLFLKSLVNVSREHLGIRIEDVATFSVSPMRVGYDTLRSKVLYGRIEDELRAVPGVTGVTSSMVPLLSGDSWGNDVRVQGFECLQDTDCNARFTAIGAGYFSMLGSSLVSGREFLPSDISGGASVAVVNQAFADKFSLGRDAVGKFMGFPTEDGDSLNIQIVGLAPNIKYNDVKRAAQPVFYLPWMQRSVVSQMYFYVRSTLPPEQLVGLIPGVVKRVDPVVPVQELKTMPQQYKENVFLDRMISTLSSAFALLATLLAGVGLYGMLAYAVSQRTREIGVRMALGASGTSVQGMVLRQVAVLTVIGATLGAVAAYAAGNAARSMLFGLSAQDPVVFALAIVLLSAVALSAGLIPARRAQRIHPMQALRYD